MRPPNAPMPTAVHSVASRTPGNAPSPCPAIHTAAAVPSISIPHTAPPNPPVDGSRPPRAAKTPIPAMDAKNPPTRRPTSAPGVSRQLVPNVAMAVDAHAVTRVSV